ncbi:hypothetical protein EJB05_33974, partial [Eragrostis curvula]
MPDIFLRAQASESETVVRTGEAAAAWQLARLALEDHGEDKFDKGGIFIGVPRKIGPHRL